MNLTDQPSAPDPARLYLASGPPSLTVVTLPGYAKEVATDFNGFPGIDESIGHRVRPFGPTLSSSFRHIGARFKIKSSCSSCRAAGSPASSLDVGPSRRPLSMSS